MTERLLCLDTSVMIKHLAPDEWVEAASRLVQTAQQPEVRLVAPAWAWAEVGTVLRKKLRTGLLQPPEAEALWYEFLDLPIDYVDTAPVRARTWDLAGRFQFLTLYDAAFLACTELAPAEPDAIREFWTADEAFLRSLGLPWPPYVRQLAP